MNQEQENINLAKIIGPDQKFKLTDNEKYKLIAQLTEAVYQLRKDREYDSFDISDMIEMGNCLERLTRNNLK